MVDSRRHLLRQRHQGNGFSFSSGCCAADIDFDSVSGPHSGTLLTSQGLRGSSPMNERRPQSANKSGAQLWQSPCSRAKSFKRCEGRAGARF